MTVLLLTGPPASGKNTVAEVIAKRRERCAVIDVALLRAMVHPYRAAWEGDDGPLQQELAVQNAAGLARNFCAAGLDVVISDAVTEKALWLYRHHLGEIPLWTVLLLPTEEEIARRTLSRPDYLSRGEVEMLYAQQEAFDDYDDKLDNTDLSPEDAAVWLLARWAEHTTS